MARARDVIRARRARRAADAPRRDRPRATRFEYEEDARAWGRVGWCAPRRRRRWSSSARHRRVPWWPVQLAGGLDR